MDKSLLSVSLVTVALALAACGNKGPLVRMTDQPPPIPVEKTVPVEETLPDTTPPEQLPATEALQTPAEDRNDEAIPPPPAAGDDGG